MNSYGALVGGIVGVIGGRERPRLSADSTAIANCVPSVLESPGSVKETACWPVLAPPPRRSRGQVSPGDFGPKSPAGRGRGCQPARDWTARTQRAVPVRPPQPCGISGARSRLDGAILGGLSAREPERVVRKRLPMRSHFTLRLSECVGGKQRASVVTPPGLSAFWPVKTRGSARWRSERPARPALRQSRGVSCESPGGRLWRSAGLWDGPETLRDASEAVYTKEPMVDVGAWDIGGRDS